MAIKRKKMILGLEEQLLAVGQKYIIQISTEERGCMKEFLEPPNTGAGANLEATLAQPAQ